MNPCRTTSPAVAHNEPTFLQTGLNHASTLDVCPKLHPYGMYLGSYTVRWDAVGAYADRLLDTDLPSTKMQQVYRLLGLARRYGPGPVNTACQCALDVDVIRVTRIASMLEKATENTQPPPPLPAAAAGARFARDPAEYRPVQLALIDGGRQDPR